MTLLSILIYLLAAVGMTPGDSSSVHIYIQTPGDSSTVHIYTQTVHRTMQLTNLVGRLSGIRTQSGQTNWEDCGPCPVFVIYILACALQMRKKYGKPLSQGSRRVPVGAMKTEYTEQNIHNHKNT
jgi:hypothetical protein